MFTGMPMHRSTQLQPLCREHLDKMNFTSRLRQGLEMRVESSRLAKYSSWFRKYRLAPHFRKEEKILIPCCSTNTGLVKKLKDDHLVILSLFSIISRTYELRYIERLAPAIDTHITWEETTLYGYIEQFLPEDQLKKIEKELHDEEMRYATGWSDEFWIY